MMEDLILGETYSYNQIEEWFDERFKTDPNSQWYEYGPKGKILMGHNFIVIESMTTYSLILTGYIEKGPLKGSQYKLIFKE